MSRAGPTLTPDQGVAARRYAGHYERVQRFGNAENRVEAIQGLARARAALQPPQVAVLDMVAGRGASLDDLARRTGRQPQDLSALLSGALDQLAAHYAAEG